ncbi:ferric iron abc transporter, atp-binding protein [hydrocarbon metagenome]|uniref:Ferric iron abc transporter, atp-binding protein n=1 Tax=hydrocarbon metagenome TaxID=938273 RepID=A0A0W8E426_9ZZZZ
MLKITDVSKSFARIKAVDNVSLQLNTGEWRILFGPSGCGKTTLLRLISGLEIPDQGSIHLGEQEVSGAGWAAPPWERRVGFVFQESALWPHMRVEENIAFGMHRLSKVHRLEFIQQILEKTGLVALRQKYPQQLSGGQSRRVALARALAAQPEYLLLDEPLTNLDEAAAAELLELIKEAARDSGAVMLYVTHNRQEAEMLEAPIIRMQQGRLLAD